jgi:hypothetical protein
MDLAAQWRLGNAQLLGGPGEVPFLGNSHEVAQMAEFHPIPSEYQTKQIWYFTFR